jgi:hypothetical protein
MKSWIVGGLAAACALTLAGGAMANTTVSVFSTYPEQVPPTLDPISGSSTTPYGLSYLALQFSPSQSGELADIDLPLYYISGTNSVIVSLWSDSGNTPGTELNSWDVTGVTSAPCCGAIPTIDLAVSGVALKAGQNYWLQLYPGESDSFIGWAYAQNELTTPEWISVSGYVEQSYTTQAFEIDASVPEPASWALAIGGLGLTGAMLRRRRMALA